MSVFDANVRASRHDDRESMFVVNDWAYQWFQDQLWNTDEGQAVGLSYFHERGLRPKGNGWHG